MFYDKFIFETEEPILPELCDSGIVLTVDFNGIGELIISSMTSGDVMWRRLSAPVKDILLGKLLACLYDHSGLYGEHAVKWNLSTFKDDKLISRPCAYSAISKSTWSLLDFCMSLAENRAGNNTEHSI